MRGEVYNLSLRDNSAWCGEGVRGDVRDRARVVWSKRMNERTSKRTKEGATDRTNKRTNEQMHERTNEGTNERANERKSEWTNVWMSEPTNERTIETNKRTNERTNGTNERTDEPLNLHRTLKAGGPHKGVYSPAFVHVSFVRRSEWRKLVSK